jgi:hypothetical protein
MIAIQVSVGIPSAATAAIELNKTNPSFYEPPGQQTVGAKWCRHGIVETIELAREFSLFRKLDSLGCGGVGGRPIRSSVTRRSTLCDQLAAMAAAPWLRAVPG